MVATSRKRRPRSAGVNKEGVGHAHGSSDEEIEIDDDDDGRKMVQKRGFTVCCSIGRVILVCAGLTILIITTVSFLPHEKVYSPTQGDGDDPAANHHHKKQKPQPNKPPPTTRRKVVTAFLESPSTLDHTKKPLPSRQTTTSTQSTNLKNNLIKREYPQIQRCRTLVQDFGTAVVNTFASSSDFPKDHQERDPFLPWIHDFFVSSDALRVQFVGQNYRNCKTGKMAQQIMQFWAPQISLFQPVPLVHVQYKNGTSSFRLFGDSHDPSSKKAILVQNPPDVLKETIIPETRFICRFHWNREEEEDNTHSMDATDSLSLSEFSFNYEYVSWRKRQPMFKEGDTVRSEFWNSQLMFSCPIPLQYQEALAASTSSSLRSDKTEGDDTPQVLVDLVPIRTPPRSDKIWVTSQMVGLQEFTRLQGAPEFFDITREYGRDHVLPPIANAGRWANLPVCPNPNNSNNDKNVDAASSARQSSSTTTTKQQQPKKPHRLVLCTWTSASYHRRGEDDGQPLNDNTLRLREWLIFHQLVGFDHVYIYDNTPMDEDIDKDYRQSPLYKLLQEFDSRFVTHQPWPAKICNNHRPHHATPGDRSSQYAAEASCRERYGPLTDWMAFIDTDEYLTPMKKLLPTGTPAKWDSVLDDMEERKVAIMKFKSGRNYPRIDLMEYVT